MQDTLSTNHIEALLIDDAYHAICHTNVSKQKRYMILKQESFSTN